MLNLYQLWLDDLYPKAKFRDGLAMVEKLGHSKRLQVSRRAWIEESKTHRRREDDEADARMEDIAQAEDDAIFPAPSETTQQNPPQQQTGGDAPDEDDLDALLREQDDAPAVTNPTRNAPARAKGPFEDDDEPDEDELDALLNEDLRQTNIAPQQQPSKQKGPFEEDDQDDQDELDMLLAEEPQRSHPVEGGNNRDSGSANPTQGGKEADFADDEEAMAEMGW
jgi:replication fork protection complex subunit Csm3/Swi3